MKGDAMLKPIAIATAVSGTLDILFAMILTVLFGREIGNMLRYVGSGPFPQATEMGAGGAILGLAVHFALMAIMAASYVLAARRVPALIQKPIQWGVLYGLATYVVMNWLVVPMRFGTPLPPSPLSMATQLFAHIVLVGIPIALITTRTLRPQPA
jgi:uncharacterized membrane protein YagU involved in acid resistance